MRIRARRAILAATALTVGLGSTAVAAVPATAATTTTASPVTAGRAVAASAGGTATSTTTRSSGSARRSAKAKVVHLTFDDGPNARYTPQVLALLKKHGAKATFFMIGDSARANPALVRRVRAEGHAIGNHTYSHPWLTRLSSAGVRRELDRTDAVLGRTSCMRPPGGFVNGTVRATSKAAGKNVVLWSVDTRDWTRPGAATIARNAIRPTRAGSIVLMHDGGGPRGQTVAALGTVLTTLKTQGYRFETLPACR